MSKIRSPCPNTYPYREIKHSREYGRRAHFTLQYWKDLTFFFFFNKLMLLCVISEPESIAQSTPTQTCRPPLTRFQPHWKMAAYTVKWRQPAECPPQKAGRLSDKQRHLAVSEGARAEGFSSPVGEHCPSS